MSSTPKEQDAHALIGALIPSEHREMFLTNAWFHEAVTQVARFVIPALVAGLAVQAEEQQQRSAELLRRIEAAPASWKSDD